MNFPGHIPGFHIPGTTIPIGAVAAQHQAAAAAHQMALDQANANELQKKKRRNHLLLFRH